MSVQVIDGGDVAALYCDTDMRPLSLPVFESAEHASDFLRFLADEDDGPEFSWFRSPDPRRYTFVELGELYALWAEVRLNENGDLLSVEVAA